MFFKQFSVDGLACQSYLIGDAGVAVVIDPERNVDDYLTTAAAQGFHITHILETHLHADHVSGNTELAARSGAQIYIHPTAAAAFARPLNGGDELTIGAVKLRALFTPGHTPDHVCLTVTDTTRSTEPWFMLAGDTLFVGDVGRPDLLGAEATRQLANQMYDSLHKQLLPLPDGLEVYPGHGAGSLCGRAMSAKLSTTLGFERKFNHALQIAERNEFVQALTSHQPSQPPNVPFIKQLNRAGPPLLGARVAHKLSASTVRNLLKQGALLVDTREPEAFGAGHVKGALNVVASSNQFATRLGFLAPPHAAVVLVARDAEACVSAMRAASRVGVDDVRGFITAAAAKKLSQEKLAQWNPVRALAAQSDAHFMLLDVREQSEYEAGHAPAAWLIPLGQLPTRLTELPVAQPIAVMCAGGIRSSSAASFLRHKGYAQVVNVSGGFEAWQKAGLPVESAD